MHRHPPASHGLSTSLILIKASAVAHLPPAPSTLPGHNHTLDLTTFLTMVQDARSPEALDSALKSSKAAVRVMAEVWIRVTVKVGDWNGGVKVRIQAHAVTASGNFTTPCPCGQVISRQCLTLSLTLSPSTAQAHQ